MDTNASSKNKKIASAIKSILVDEFENIEIVNVKVDNDIDSDSEEILRITVVFLGTPKDSDYRTLAGAVRRTRPKLNELGEKAFPIFSFVSKVDAGAAFDSK